MTFVEACRAWKSVTGSLPVDVTIVIEGEEEIGSKNFVPFLEKNKDDLEADFALVCDTSMWDPEYAGDHHLAARTCLRGGQDQGRQPRSAFRHLRSGAQNPIRVLTRILGSLFDDDGHITIPGFYDGREGLCRRTFSTQWSKLNLTPESFLKPIGLSMPAGEKGRLLIEQVSSRPTCDVNGIIGGYTGEGSKTVIPAEASAKISFRLVEGQEPGKIRKAFRDYVTARLPRDCTAEFTDHSSAPAIALDWNMKPLAAAKRALTEEWGKGSGPDRLRRLDPDRGGFQAHARPRHGAGGLWAGRRQHPFAERKYDLQSFHKGIRSWARTLPRRWRHAKGWMPVAGGTRSAHYGCILARISRGSRPAADDYDVVAFGDGAGDGAGLTELTVAGNQAGDRGTGSPVRPATESRRRSPGATSSCSGGANRPRAVWRTTGFGLGPLQFCR